MPLVFASSNVATKVDAMSSSWHPCNRNIVLRSERPGQQIRGAHHQHETTTTSPNSDNNNKRVAFLEKDTIHYTISRKDILPMEQAATWFSPEEFQTIAQSCLLQIMKLNLGERLKDKRYCARGLESETKVGLRETKMNRSLAQKLVLEEQDRQRCDGVRESDHLAYLYHSATSSCQVWANVVGLSDQRAAEDVMETVFTVKCSHTSSTGWNCPPSKPFGPSLMSRNIELARAA